MSRRRNTRSDRRGCGRVPTYALVLVALAVLGYALLGNQRVESTFGIDVEGLFETYVTDYFGGNRGGTSVEGIMAAVSAAGWEPTGEGGVVENSDHSMHLREYRKGEKTIMAEVRAFDSTEAAKGYRETAERPARYVRFGSFVATVEGRSGASAGDAVSVIEHLKTYRNMLEDADE